MKSSLVSGLEKTATITIGKDRTTGHMGDDLRVYATPSMVLDFERETNNFILEHLDPGEGTVGAHVSVDHLAPSLEGDTVTFTLKIVKIDGRMIEVEGNMHDSIEPCGRGLHRRFVVDTARQFERLKTKRGKLSA